jgi:hypothetical protein
MTRYSETQRKEMATQVKGKTIKKQTYTKDGDYYTILLSDGTEFSFRFMADIIGGT